MGLMDFWNWVFGRKKSSTPFSKWYVAESPISGQWRVVDDNYSVMCTARSKIEADDIARDHNQLDPIKSYEDWLFHKC